MAFAVEGVVEVQQLQLTLQACLQTCEVIALAQ